MSEQTHPTQEPHGKVLAALTAQYPQVTKMSSLPHECAAQMPADIWQHVALWLVSHHDCQFHQLVDLTVVDYLAYGLSEWANDEVASASLSRARVVPTDPSTAQPHRFALVVHLQSIALNQRLRVHVWLPNDDPPCVHSVEHIWPVANWYEREAFDMFGVQFMQHSDCRRILTDYGFKGHPLRKDFPVSGHVEMRYDATEARCVYEKVTVVPRVTVAKVIREDGRYQEGTPHD